MRGRRTPWRDNIEAAVGAVLLAVLFKYFLVEFYKIPSGSMQPTLYGAGAPLNLYDRVVADKLSFHFREPERFEVVIFRYPLDRARNFVKRLVGLPGEELKLEHGDIWVRASPDEPWRIPRRPAGVMQGQWRRLASDRAATRWSVRGLAGAPAPAWTIADGVVDARGAGALEFTGAGADGILDVYLDGYPPAVAAQLPSPQGTGRNAVGDLRLSGELRPLPGCTSVTFELQEGPVVHRFQVPGPAGAPDLRARIDSVPRPGRRAGGEPAGVYADARERLQAGRAVHFEVENLDDRLALRLDGREVLSLEIAALSQQDAGVRIEIEGQGAELSGLELARDVYYADGRGGGPWNIPDGHFFMLGDNTQDSSDSRDWMRASLAWRADDGRQVQASGNYRPASRSGPIPGDTNPVRSTHPESGASTWLRDEWGEGHHFDSAREVTLPGDVALAAAPFVPRELITGRALASLWPLRVGLGVWRPKWIR